MGNAKQSQSGAEAGELRGKARRRVRRQKTGPPQPEAPADVRALVEQLQLRQAELEAQNEELHRAQAAAHELSAQYRQLFDFASAGHFLLDKRGRILEVNLAGAALLGQERAGLLRKPIGRFVAPEDGLAFAAFSMRVLETGTKQAGDFRLLAAGQTVYAILEAVAAGDAEGSPQRWRLAVINISQRKRAEGALRNSEERYRALVEGADVGIALIDSAHNVLMVSKKLGELFRGTPGELIGKKCFRSLHGQQAACADCAGFKAMATGRPAETETIKRRNDGSTFTAHVKASPLLDEDGEPTGFIEVVEDITQRRRAEQERKALLKALEAEKSHLADVFMRSPAFMVVLRGPEHVVERANEEYFCLVGRHDIVNKPLRAALPELEGQGCLEILDRVYQTGEPFVGQQMPILLRRTAEGPLEQRCVDFLYQPLREADGSISGIFVHGVDITERQRAEEELRLSERRQRVILDTISDPAWLKDSAGRYLALNGAWCRFFGLEAHEALGKTALDLLSPEIAERLQEKDREVLRSGAPLVHEETLHDSGGRRVWFETLKNPLYSADGEIIGTVGIAHDITDRKRAEEALRQAKEAAEAANRAKSEFLANMSHEIRTPMTAILGFADLLMSPNLPYSEQREFLEAIRRNGRALLELISNILDLSRIEADKLTLEKTDCSLQQIVDDVLSVVRMGAIEKGLSLEVDYQCPLSQHSHTDPARLRQILINLAGNAVKFTECGGVRLSVRCLPAAGQSMRVQIAVADTGIGIAAEKMGELFQPFVQADTSLTRRHGGTGLGLAISQRLAKALGGDIEVASELGKGSTFTLTIDAGPLEGTGPFFGPNVSHENRRTTEEWTSPRSQLHGRVLVVEDVADVRLVLAEILRKMSLEVDVASDGREACDLAEQSKTEGRPYDLILMDIQMPVMDGYQATRWLRQQDWQGPIVAVTAHALAEDREKCLAAGCDNYIAKPITADGLRSMLAQYLHPEATPAGPAPSGGRAPADPSGLLEGGLLDADKVAQLIEAFAAELPARISGIQDALNQRDLQRLQETAHELKGTAGIYGFSDVSAAADVLDQRASEGDDLQQLQAAVAELVELCAPLTAAHRRCLGRSRPKG